MQKLPDHVEKVFDSPEVFKVAIPFRNVVTTETNVYVVRDSGDVLLVDMGAPTDEAQLALEEALSCLGVDLGAARVFFTHMHFDHSGLAKRMLGGNAEIYVNSLELRSAKPDFMDAMNEMVCKRLIEEGMEPARAKRLTSSVELATSIADGTLGISTVKGGDAIQVGDYTFHVIDLPGHTRGMMGLYQPDTGICFSGDQLLFIITPTTGLFLDRSDSIQAFEQSMERLISLDASMLFHSHGDIRPDFKERATSILASKHRRSDEAVDAIARLASAGKPPTGIEVIESLKWRIPYSSISECEPRQQWLIYTQGASVLDHVVEAGRAKRLSLEVNCYGI